MKAPICRLVLPSVIVALGLVAGSAEDDNPLAKKHLQFLQSRLDHKDDQIRCYALDALAVHDPASQMPRLKAGIHDASYLVRFVALKHLRGHADQETLAKVKQVAEESAPKAENEEDGSNFASTESMALAVLVASGDAKARTFAIERLRTVLGSDDTPRSRWVFMSDVAVDNELKELLPVVKKAKAERRERVVWVSAILGDADAIKEIREAMRSDKEWVLSSLAFDRRAREVLGIEVKELRERVRSHSFEEATDKHIFLAYLGEHEEFLKDLASIRTFAPHVQVRILSAADNIGDERCLKSLDEFLADSRDESLQATCSTAFVKISARLRKACSDGN